jgi:hypothetical protein
MKEMTWGTFISCMFLCFMLGFLACHKLYIGLERNSDVNYDYTRWNNPSLRR